jgi:hypothetical protein
MNTTLSPVAVQRFSALQGERITLAEQDYTGLTPKLEQVIRACEFTPIELAVYRDRGYAQGRGVGQPESDRCALVCAFLAKKKQGQIPIYPDRSPHCRTSSIGTSMRTSTRWTLECPLSPRRNMMPNIMMRSPQLRPFVMRTTLDIEDDVLAAAKEMARRQHVSAGQVISRLSRQSTEAGSGQYQTGFLWLPSHNGLLPLDLQPQK